MTRAKSLLHILYAQVNHFQKDSRPSPFLGTGSLPITRLVQFLTMIAEDIPPKYVEHVKGEEIIRAYAVRAEQKSTSALAPSSYSVSPAITVTPFATYRGSTIASFSLPSAFGLGRPSASSLAATSLAYSSTSDDSGKPPTPTSSVAEAPDQPVAGAQGKSPGGSSLLSYFAKEPPPFASDSAGRTNTPKASYTTQEAEFAEPPAPPKRKRPRSRDGDPTDSGPETATGKRHSPDRARGDTLTATPKEEPISDHAAKRTIEEPPPEDSSPTKKTKTAVHHPPKAEDTGRGATDREGASFLVVAPQPEVCLIV